LMHPGRRICIDGLGAALASSDAGPIEALDEIVA
jgi:hypothetical protein